MSGPHVLFLTSGQSVPSTRYRILPYLPRLQAAGICCDLAQSFPEKYKQLFPMGWKASRLLRKMTRRIDLWKARRRNYDAIILEREIFNDPTWHLEAAFRAVTRRFILDLDDAIFLNYPDKFARIAGMADQVLAGNQALAAESRKHCENVTVLPTAIDLDEYRFSSPRQPNEVPVIGWIGTASNVAYLKTALPALEQLAAHRRFVLRIVTSHKSVIRKLPFRAVNVEFHRWSAQTATTQIRQFDIGIMPLPDGPWERYKCGFKLLQYMACNMPAVASPVGVNSEIITHGVNGFLAGTTEDWLESFNFILDTPEHARFVGEAARKRIEQTYCIDVQFPKMMSAIVGNGQDF